MALSYAELEGVWIQAGGNKAVAPLMAAIALAESGGDPNAKNATDNNGRQTSWGLWQISDGTHNEVSPTWNNPLTNAKLAVAKYNGPQGLSAWGTYTSGAYKKFMQGGVVPQNPSGINGTQPTGGTTQAGITSDIGGAIADGLLSGFAAAMGPVLKWGLWFLETALGFVVMAGGVILLVQSSETARSAEKSVMRVTPAGRLETSPSPLPVPSLNRPAPKPKPETNPYSGKPVRDAKSEQARRTAIKNAAAAKRIQRARVKAAREPEDYELKPPKGKK